MNYWLKEIGIVSTRILIILNKMALCKYDHMLSFSLLYVIELP